MSKRTISFGESIKFKNKSLWALCPEYFSEKTLNNYAEKFGFAKTRYFYETRFWDASGRGTFYYKLMELFGSTWEKRYLGKISYIQRKAGKLGRVLDKFVFKTNWEAKKRKSGILIAEFTK